MGKGSHRTPFFSFRENTDKKKWVIGLLILLITLLWGVAWVLMKVGLEYMGPFTFSSLRFATGTFTLFLILAVKRVSLPEKRQWKHFMIIGLLQTTIVFSLVMYGMKFVEAGKSSVLLYSMPMWSGLFASKLLGEKITFLKGIGMLLGTAGLLFILGWDLWQQQSYHVIFGEMLIVAAAVSWALANVYYRKNLSGVNQLQVNAYQMMFGTFGILIAAMVSEWGEPVLINSVSIFSVVFTGVLASALCFTVWYYVLSVIDTVTATMSTLLVPVFGLFFSWKLLGEEITLNIAIGTVLIILGIFIAQQSGSSRQKKRGLGN